MADTHDAPVDLEDIRNPDTEFETSDLPLRVIGLAALGLTLLLGISPVVLLYWFPGVGMDVSRKLRVLPPQPRLQIKPSGDLQAELSRQRAVLDSYEWLDHSHDIARVPVTVAMEQLTTSGIAGFPKPASYPPGQAQLAVPTQRPSPAQATAPPQARP